MKYLSVCSGIEAASVAWDAFGWEPAAFAEIEPFASAVLKHRFPHVPNLGDFTKIGKNDVGAIDLLVGGTPCFAAGTLVLLKRGLVRIEDVVVGDFALTHLGRYRRVEAVGSKRAETVRVVGQGVATTTTAKHRFWAAQTESRTTRRAGVSVRVKTISDPAWVAAEELLGAHVATPCRFPSSDPPPLTAHGRENEAPPLSPELFYLVGVWVGDGWTRMNERRGSVMICAARGPQARDLETRLRATFSAVTVTQERTTERFTIYSKPMVRWLREHFGSGAGGKTVPAWLLGAPWEMRRAFLSGYLFADGSTLPNGRRFTTISPRLALGVSMLAHSLGFSTSRYLSNVSPTTVIEGRTVRQRPHWMVSIYDRARSSYESGGHRFGLVRHVEPTGRLEIVYDLTVEEDHSYVADGSCVHNCQDFSVAGLRAGMDGARGALTIEFVKLLDRIRPEWVVWENVPGVLSSDDGRAFGTFLGLLGQCGYGFAYRILDAQFYGVPQRRRRVFVVGRLGDWRGPAAVLFERACLSWDSPPSRKPRSDADGIATDGAGGGFEDQVATTLQAREGQHGPRPDSTLVAMPFAETSDCNAAADNGSLFVAHSLTAQSQLKHDHSMDTYVVTGPLLASGAGTERPPIIAHTLRAEGHDASEDGTGRGVPLIVDMRGREGGMQAEVDPDGVAAAIHATDDGSTRSIIAFTLTADSPTGGGQRQSVASESSVRRLTPRECERLQGFPDDWTLVPFRRKPAADGPRYRSLGNSMAVPVMRWIGARIVAVEKILKA
jgi:DNA-cytosine methyltransferase